jgi:hypothetical protein
MERPVYVNPVTGEETSDLFIMKIWREEGIEPRAKGDCVADRSAAPLDVSWDPNDNQASMTVVELDPITWLPLRPRPPSLRGDPHNQMQRPPRVATGELEDGYGMGFVGSVHGGGVHSGGVHGGGVHGGGVHSDTHLGEPLGEDLSPPILVRQ